MSGTSGTSGAGGAGGAGRGATIEQVAVEGAEGTFIYFYHITQSVDLRNLSTVLD